MRPRHRDRLLVGRWLGQVLGVEHELLFLTGEHGIIFVHGATGRGDFYLRALIERSQDAARTGTVVWRGTAPHDVAQATYTTCTRHELCEVHINTVHGWRVGHAVEQYNSGFGHDLTWRLKRRGNA